MVSLLGWKKRKKYTDRETSLKNCICAFYDLSSPQAFLARVKCLYLENQCNENSSLSDRRQVKRWMHKCRLKQERKAACAAPSLIPCCCRILKSCKFLSLPCGRVSLHLIPIGQWLEHLALLMVRHVLLNSILSGFVAKA